MYFFTTEFFANDNGDFFDNDGFDNDEPDFDVPPHFDDLPATASENIAKASGVDEKAQTLKPSSAVGVQKTFPKTPSIPKRVGSKTIEQVKLSNLY